MGTFTVIPMPALIQETRNRFVFWSPSALPNTTKQMKVKEGRDIYVTDTMVALVYECRPLSRMLLILLYLTPQRPADVL